MQIQEMVHLAVYTDTGNGALSSSTVDIPRPAIFWKDLCIHIIRLE